MCKRHNKLDSVLAALIVALAVAGWCFVMYSTQASCESKLAPAHKYCAD